MTLRISATALLTAACVFWVCVALQLLNAMRLMHVPPPASVILVFIAPATLHAIVLLGRLTQRLRSVMWILLADGAIGFLFLLVLVFESAYRVDWSVAYQLELGGPHRIIWASVLTLIGLIGLGQVLASRRPPRRLIDD
jgi:hypothetical protein